MSLRYTGAWLQDGAFNPLTAPTGVPTYYPYLYSFGQGYGGALALGNTTSYSSPKQVGSLTDWSKLASSTRYANLSIKTDGTLWSWGFNNNGQLGLGNTTQRNSPVQVGALTNWLDIAAGWYHSAATKTDGTLWTWGGNGNGQLGLNNTTSYSSPKQVGSLTNWLSVACGYGYTMAIKIDGTLWGWGNNGNGRLGIGNTTDYSSPKQIGALTTWYKVACGTAHTLATKTDGTLWSWGSNSNGELGIGNTTAYSSPKQIGALTNWLYIACTQSAGNPSSGSVKTDGTLWTWGNNLYGSLGIGTSGAYTNRSSPVQVGALTNWGVLDAGGRHFMSVKTNGQLWVWGYNGGGQLGNSTTTDSSSPIQVGALTTWLNLSGGYNYTLATQY